MKQKMYREVFLLTLIKKTQVMTVVIKKKTTKKEIEALLQRFKKETYKEVFTFCFWYL